MSLKAGLVREQLEQRLAANEPGSRTMASHALLGRGYCGVYGWVALFLGMLACFTLRVPLTAVTTVDASRRD
jgi:hypothetical protein